MAHFKRKRSRRQSSGYYSKNALQRRLGFKGGNEGRNLVRWLDNWPRNHDKINHTHPTRRKTRNLERRVIRGGDYDDMVWPDGQKPHIYYW